MESINDNREPFQYYEYNLKYVLQPFWVLFLHMLHP